MFSIDVYVDIFKDTGSYKIQELTRSWTLARIRGCDKMKKKAGYNTKKTFSPDTNMSHNLDIVKS